MKRIEFIITTPTGVVYKSQATSVTVDTMAGQLTILPEHTPLLTTLGAGEVVVRNDEEEVSLAVHGGFLEVQKGSVVTVLADGALRAEDIDEERLQDAIKRAQEMKEKETDKTSIEYTKLSALLEKELARLRVMQKQKKYKIDVRNKD